MRITRSTAAKKFLHACAFIPFIGWMLPLYLLPEDETAQKNAKVALTLAGYTAVLYGVFILIDFFIPETWVMPLFIVNVLLYAVLIAYFLILAAGVVFALLNKIFALPYVSTKAFQLPV